MRIGIGLVLAAVVAAGCGGESEENKAAKPVKEYIAAVGAGNAERACEQLTGDYQRTFVADGETCAEAMAHVVIGPDEVDGYKVTKFRVDLRGRRATVTPEGWANSLIVSKVDGRWLVSSEITALESAFDGINTCIEEATTEEETDECLSYK